MKLHRFTQNGKNNSQGIIGRREEGDEGSGKQRQSDEKSEKGKNGQKIYEIIREMMV